MTEQEINEFKNNPIIGILCSAMGTTPDEIINEYKKSEATDSSKPSKDITPDENDPTYPFSVGEFKQLIYELQDFYREGDKFDETGIDIWSTPIIRKADAMITYLLSIIFDQKYADLIMDHASNTKVDPDTIVYDLIDLVNNE